MQVEAICQLARHRPPRVTCVTSRVLALAMTLGLLTPSGCSPPALQAGHSLAKAPTVENQSTHRSDKAPSAKKPSSESDIAHDVAVSESPAPAVIPPAFSKLPAGGRLIGEAGGIAPEGLSATGHWVATCQTIAKANPQALRPDMPTGLRGEAIQPFELELTWGSRREPIDAVLRSDDSGRYLVVLQDERAWLLDAVAETRHQLSALTPDLEGDSLPDHRAFAFSDRGLVVISAQEDIDAYFLPLPLSDDPQAGDPVARAVPLEFGKRPIWRVDAGNGYLTAATIGEGKTSQAWPVPKATGPIHRCQGAVPSYPAFSRISAYRPDRDIAYFWLKLPEHPQKLTKLVADPAPGYVMPHQAGWVRREDSGRLVHVSGGTQKQIASERCGARILHADDATGLFVAACEDYTPVLEKPLPAKPSKTTPKFRFELYLLRAGFVRSLPGDTARTGVDVKGPAHTRFVPLRPGTAAALVDLNAQKLIPLDPSVYVLAAGQGHALLRDENQLKLWSPRGTEHLDYPLSSLSLIMNVGKTTAIDDRIFFLDATLSTWKLPAPPIALSPLGYSLVPSEPASDSRWARGPLLLLGPAE